MHLCAQFVHIVDRIITERRNREYKDFVNGIKSVHDNKYGKLLRVSLADAIRAVNNNASELPSYEEPLRVLDNMTHVEAFTLYVILYAISIVY